MGADSTFEGGLEDSSKRRFACNWSKIWRQLRFLHWENDWNFITDEKFVEIRDFQQKLLLDTLLELFQRLKSIWEASGSDLKTISNKNESILDLKWTVIRFLPNCLLQKGLFHKISWIFAPFSYLKDLRGDQITFKLQIAPISMD